MEYAKAEELLRVERARTEQLLSDLREEGTADRDAADEPGDMFDNAEPLTTEGTDDSVRAELEEHLAAIDRAQGRAQGRLKAGTYGYSVRSGQPIPDARLESDPAAELTVEEASEPA
jgi:DnaK suppressor protein